MKALTDTQKFLAAYPPEVQSLARELRRHVLETVPGLVEMVDTSAKINADSGKY
jgi:hypothetical protein